MRYYTWAVNHFPSGSHFVEVGTWKGMGAAYMAVEIINSGKNIKFDCIDTWEYVPSQTEISESMYENLYETFLKNIEPVKHVITPIRSLSCDGAKYYEDNSLDFVFIEAAHEYENVKKDLHAWYPKIKKNGVIAGDDYPGHQGVKSAMDEFFAGKGLWECEGCWIYFTDVTNLIL